MCHGMKITSLLPYDKRNRSPHDPAGDLRYRASRRTRRLNPEEGTAPRDRRDPQLLRTNERPIYFVSATAFNLLGIDRWVRNFKFINYYDSFDGFHPNVFVPKERSPREFSSIEEICNYLLAHKEVADFVSRRGPGGKATFLMFDEETEQLAGELGLEVAFPSASLRHRLDSKIVTTQLGNEAGVPSVPNAMGRANDYAALMQLARGGGLGASSSGGSRPDGKECRMDGAVAEARGGDPGRSHGRVGGRAPVGPGPGRHPHRGDLGHLRAPFGAGRGVGDHSHSCQDLPGPHQRSGRHPRADHPAGDPGRRLPAAPGRGQRAGAGGAGGGLRHRGHHRLGQRLRGAGLRLPAGALLDDAGHRLPHLDRLPGQPVRLHRLP